MATVLEERSATRRARHGGATALRVGVDATQIVFGVSGGVEVYFKTLVQALLDERRGFGRVEPIIIARQEQERPLRETFGDVALRVLPTVYSPLPIRVTRWLRRKLGPPPAMQAPPPPSTPFGTLEAELELDVIHSPVQLFSDCAFRVPGVLNLHDLQHVHFPENFTPAELAMRAQLYVESARHAAAVVASSEFVRQDIVAHLDLPSEKVHVIPVACDPQVIAGANRFSAEMARSHYTLPEVYAFYPAAFWPHKNHVRLIEALAIVRSRTAYDLKLVCAGCRDHSGRAAVEQALDRHGVRDHVRFLDYIPTEHLAAVYRAAAFCVVPSLFEASSYPVIEAQSLGVAAMCSDVTSLPELMENGAGLLFDPRSADEIAAAMTRWLDDPDDRQAHAVRGRERALRENSMKTYASRMRGLYDSISGRDTDV